MVRVSNWIHFLINLPMMMADVQAMRSRIIPKLLLKCLREILLNIGNNEKNRETRN